MRQGHGARWARQRPQNRSAVPFCCPMHACCGGKQITLALTHVRVPQTGTAAWPRLRHPLEPDSCRAPHTGCVCRLLPGGRAAHACASEPRDIVWRGRTQRITCVPLACVALLESDPGGDLHVNASTLQALMGASLMQALATEPMGPRATAAPTLWHGLVRTCCNRLYLQSAYPMALKAPCTAVNGTASQWRSRR